MAQPLRLNLGSGGIRLDGFVNVDVDPRGADVAAKIDALPFAAGAAEMLYASHVLEHYQGNVPALLRSWHALLKPGGLLYIGVPDFDALARIYTEPGAALSIRATVLAAVFGGHRNQWDVHHAGYSRDNLTTLLIEAGFADVTPFDVFAHDETRHAIAGQPISLNLRAVKLGATPAAPPEPQAEDELAGLRRSADERLAVLLKQRKRIEELEARCRDFEAHERQHAALLGSPLGLLRALFRAVLGRGGSGPA